MLSILFRHSWSIVGPVLKRRPPKAGQRQENYHNWLFKLGVPAQISSILVSGRLVFLGLSDITVARSHALNHSPNEKPDQRTGLKISLRFGCLTEARMAYNRTMEQTRVMPWFQKEARHGDRRLCRLRVWDRLLGDEEANQLKLNVRQSQPFLSKRLGEGGRMAPAMSTLRQLSLVAVGQSRDFWTRLDENLPSCRDRIKSRIYGRGNARAYLRDLLRTRMVLRVHLRADCSCPRRHGASGGCTRRRRFRIRGHFVVAWWWSLRWRSPSQVDTSAAPFCGPMAATHCRRSPHGGPGGMRRAAGTAIDTATTSCTITITSSTTTITSGIAS
jgi:hypothetical protein